jgi:hypothetical protein
VKTELIPRIAHCVIAASADCKFVLTSLIEWLNMYYRHRRRWFSIQVMPQVMKTPMIANKMMTANTPLVLKFAAKTESVAAIRHALNGATASEMMAWFGWKNIAEAQRYCEMADRKTMAKSAGNKMIAGTSGEQNLLPAEPQVALIEKS